MPTDYDFTDKTNKNRKYEVLIWAGILFAQILFFLLGFLSKEKWIVYHENFFEFQKKFHQNDIFSIFPFSVGDVIIWS